MFKNILILTTTLICSAFLLPGFAISPGAAQAQVQNNLQQMQNNKQQIQQTRRNQAEQVNQQRNAQRQQVQQNHGR